MAIRTGACADQSDLETPTLLRRGPYAYRQGGPRREWFGLTIDEFLRDRRRYLRARRPDGDQAISDVVDVDAEILVIDSPSDWNGAREPDESISPILLPRGPVRRHLADRGAVETILSSIARATFDRLCPTTIMETFGDEVRSDWDESLREISRAGVMATCDFVLRELIWAVRQRASSLFTKDT
jgi:hypothetical protein